MLEEDALGDSLRLQPLQLQVDHEEPLQELLGNTLAHRLQDTARRWVVGANSLRTKARGVQLSVLDFSGGEIGGGLLWWPTASAIGSTDRGMQHTLLDFSVWETGEVGWGGQQPRTARQIGVCNTHCLISAAGLASVPLLLSLPCQTLT